MKTTQVLYMYNSKQNDSLLISEHYRKTGNRSLHYYVLCQTILKSRLWAEIKA